MKTIEPYSITVNAWYPTSSEKLWKIITGQHHMVKWFFTEIPAFEPIRGFRTTFSMFSGKREFIHDWDIAEVFPGKKISYNWKYNGYGGLARVNSN